MFKTICLLVGDFNRSKKDLSKGISQMEMKLEKLRQITKNWNKKHWIYMDTRFQLSSNFAFLKATSHLGSVPSLGGPQNLKNSISASQLLLSIKVYRTMLHCYMVCKTWCVCWITLLDFCTNQMDSRKACRVELIRTLKFSNYIWLGKCSSLIKQKTQKLLNTSGRTLGLSKTSFLDSRALAS